MYNKNRVMNDACAGDICDFNEEVIDKILGGHKIVNNMYKYGKFDAGMQMSLGGPSFRYLASEEYKCDKCFTDLLNYTISLLSRLKCFIRAYRIYQDVHGCVCFSVYTNIGAVSAYFVVSDGGLSQIQRNVANEISQDKMLTELVENVISYCSEHLMFPVACIEYWLIHDIHTNYKAGYSKNYYYGVCEAILDNTYILESPGEYVFAVVDMLK